MNNYGFRCCRQWVELPEFGKTQINFDRVDELMEGSVFFQPLLQAITDRLSKWDQDWRGSLHLQSPTVHHNSLNQDFVNFYTISEWEGSGNRNAQEITTEFYTNNLVVENWWRCKRKFYFFLIQKLWLICVTCKEHFIYFILKSYHKKKQKKNKTLILESIFFRKSTTDLWKLLNKVEGWMDVMDSF